MPGAVTAGARVGVDGVAVVDKGRRRKYVVGREGKRKQ